MPASLQALRKERKEEEQELQRCIARGIVAIGEMLAADQERENAERERAYRRRRHTLVGHGAPEDGCAELILALRECSANEVEAFLTHWPYSEAEKRVAELALGLKGGQP